MWRRIVLVLGVIGLVAGCGGSAETTTSDTSVAQPEQTFKWRLVTTWPKNFPGMGMAPEKLADRVREMSSGRLDIKVYGAGELVPALDIRSGIARHRPDGSWRCLLLARQCTSGTALHGGTLWAIRARDEWLVTPWRRNGLVGRTLCPVQPGAARGW